MPEALSVKIQDVRGEFSRTFKVTVALGKGHENDTQQWLQQNWCFYMSDSHFEKGIFLCDNDKWSFRFDISFPASIWVFQWIEGTGKRDRFFQRLFSKFLSLPGSNEHPPGSTPHCTVIPNPQKNKTSAKLHVVCINPTFTRARFTCAKSKGTEQNQKPSSGLEGEIENMKYIILLGKKEEERLEYTKMLNYNDIIII